MTKTCQFSLESQKRKSVIQNKIDTMYEYICASVLCVCTYIYNVFVYLRLNAKSVIRIH